MKKTLILLLVLLICTTSAWGVEKKISVKLSVPDAAWTITIDEVHRIGNELWVISTVSRDPDIMGAQMISTVQASLGIEAPDLTLSYFVIGKTWDWPNQEPYSFIDDRQQIEKELKHGELLYKRSQKN